MSIGSETFTGIVNVTVRNLSIDGADNGLRIKSGPSYGGSVWGKDYYLMLLLRMRARTHIANRFQCPKE